MDDISCRLLVEGDIKAKILKERIKEALQNYPKLSGLSLEVTEMKKGNIENLEYINEEEKINTQLKSNDIIYFDLDLKEVWLNIDLLLKEENVMNSTNKDLKEINSLFNLDLKIPKEISQENLYNKLINISLNFLDFRDDNINEEIENKNENRDIKYNDNIDYFFLTKFNVIIESTDLDANNNARRKRAKTMRKERDIYTKFNSNSINNKLRQPRFSTKNLIEMAHLPIPEETNSKLNKRMDRNSLDEIKEIKEPIIDDMKEPNGKDDKKIIFNINNKVNCNVSYTNFTNYVLKDETFYRTIDFPDMKKLFNKSFADFYKNINLEEDIRLRKGKKILYLQENKRYLSDVATLSSNENDNDNRNSNIYLDYIKNIDYTKKIEELQQYILEKDFWEETFKGEFIRINKVVNNNENNIIKEKSNEEENNNDNSECSNSFIDEGNNNHFLTKKRIFIVISAILFIIILLAIV